MTIDERSRPTTRIEEDAARAAPEPDDDMTAEEWWEATAGDEDDPCRDESLAVFNRRKDKDAV